MDNTLIHLIAGHFKSLYSYDQRSYTGFNGNIDEILENTNPNIIMFI